MISEGYRKQLEQMHVEKEHFGKRSSIWAKPVFEMCAVLETEDVLDYGCGKGELNLHLPFAVKGYDPGVPKYVKTPEPADVVVCTDVLEHIEPDHLDDVLADLKRVTRKALMLHVHTKPANKTLPDGRNAHLIVQDKDWWMEHFKDWKRKSDVMDAVSEKHGVIGFTVVLEP